VRAQSTSGDNLVSDEQIICRVLGGHTDDFRVLLQRYQERTFRLAYRILGTYDDGQDAVQETFLRVYQALPGYRHEGKLWPWIRRIATNVCLKRLPSEPKPDELDDSIESADLVETQVLGRIELANVGKAIGGLPTRYRLAIIVRYQEELTCREIAEELGEKVTTIKVRLHRAERMLAERLKVLMNDEV